MASSLQPWSVAAVNLAEHADNPVHTDAGGRAAGYRGAVVAGTTVYAYLTRPVAAAWGEDWVGRGSATVRFRSAVIADERVDVTGLDTEHDTVSVEARIGATVAASATFARTHDELAPPTGARLEPLVAPMDDAWTGYPGRVGEDLALYRERGIVHPVVWPCLANRVFSAQLVTGSWVHTRSTIRHLGLVRPGAVVVVEAFEVDRFETRSGERAVVDLRMTVDDEPVVAVEHEAIVRLAGQRDGIGGAGEG